MARLIVFYGIEFVFVVNFSTLHCPLTALWVRSLAVRVCGCVDGRVSLYE